MMSIEEVANMYANMSIIQDDSLTINKTSGRRLILEERELVRKEIVLSNFKFSIKPPIIRVSKISLSMY